MVTKKGRQETWKCGFQGESQGLHIVGVMIKFKQSCSPRSYLFSYFCILCRQLNFRSNHLDRINREWRLMGWSFQEKYLKGTRYFENKIVFLSFRYRKCVKFGSQVLQQGLRWWVSNGKSIDLWFDDWMIGWDLIALWVHFLFLLVPLFLMNSLQIIPLMETRAYPNY